MAKEALSAATAQAAEKAATSVKDLAQRSFRVSVNIDLKAPVIVIPQSSVSTNAVVVDLGLIRVHNQFSLVSGEDTASPPVIDKMEVQLTKLKLSRYACSVAVLWSVCKFLLVFLYCASFTKNHFLISWCTYVCILHVEPPVGLHFLYLYIIVQTVIANCLRIDILARCSGACL